MIRNHSSLGCFRQKTSGSHLFTSDGVLTANQVLDYYVKQYLNHGIHPTRTFLFPNPPLSHSKFSQLTHCVLSLVNWYRTRRINWEEEQELLDRKIITQPVLFIQATQDSVLTPELSKGMEKFIPNMTRGEVATSHWAMIQKPDEVNEIIRQWFVEQGLADKQPISQL